MKHFYSLFFILLFVITGSVEAKAQNLLSVSDTAGCSPLKIKFGTSFKNVVSYAWEFGDGNTSTLANPTNLYTGTGFYTVKLKVRFGDGKIDSAIIANAVHVVAHPEPDFNLPVTLLCPGQALQFTNRSKNTYRLIWDFGDGVTSTDANPIHAYKGAGTYTVKLMAVNSFGCAEVKEAPNALTIQALPDAAFTASDTMSCDASKSFAFSFNGSNASSYLWSFGDGATSMLSNPTHAYNKTGKFTVSLKAWNSNGCSDSIAKKDFIFIDNPSNPAFTVSGGNACLGSVVRFTDSTSGAVSWFWNFGDGATSTDRNPTHSYSSSGKFSVTLTTINTAGCKSSVTQSDIVTVNGNLTANFTGKFSGCAPLAVNFTNHSVNATSYLWDFGDGSTSTTKNPAHIYYHDSSYTVILHAFSKTGCEKIYSIKDAVIILPRPKAAFSLPFTSGCPPFTAHFQNKYQEGNSYLWDFGDHTYSTDTNPVHVYNKEGTYSIKLISTNKGGCKDTILMKNYLQLKVPDIKYAGAKTISGCIPFITTLSDAASGNVAWNWDFGDGTSSTLQSPQHIWSKAGKYSVTLTTITASGCRITLKDFQVFDLHDYKATFTYKVSDCPPYVVNFTDSAPGAVKWFWDFGDGTTSSIQSPQHTFQFSGNYVVTLTVNNPSGCSYSISKKLHFNSYGESFSITPLSPTSATVVFKANTSNYSSLLWYFGDGDSSTDVNPTHTYAKRDTKYQATLMVFFSASCQAKITKQVFPPPAAPTSTVSKPTAMFTPSANGGCAPLAINFLNQSRDYLNARWDFGDGNTSGEKSPQHVFTKTGSYTVTLTVSNALNTASKYSFVIHATEVTPSFTADEKEEGDESIFSFENRTAGAAKWYWDFGDGTTSTDENPTHIFSDSNTIYNVRLSVTDSFGCTGNTVKAIQNNNLIGVSTVSQKGCAGEPIQFTLKTKTFRSYIWNFGDSTTSTDPTGSHAYKQGGWYSPTVMVKDEGGNTFTYRMPYSVQIFAPKAQFYTKGLNHSCDSLTLAFVNESSAADSFLWQFGDGSISREKSPVHTYRTEGSFNATLVAYGNGCSNTYTVEKSAVVFSAHPGFTTEQANTCFPVTVHFTDHSTHPVSWHWDFGDGSTSAEQNPTHIFYEVPKNEVKLTIRDSDGCAGTYSHPAIQLVKSQFDVQNAKGCLPFTVSFANNSIMGKSWYWDFGDGNTSIERNPVHVYTKEGQFTVRLVARAEEGCTDTFTKWNLITASAVHAGFSTPVRSNCAPVVIAFNDNSRNAAKWHWDFGDGESAEIAAPVHIYDHPGYYTVKQIVTNDFGCTDTLVRTNYIHILGPVSAFTVNETSGCQPMKAVFTDKSVNAVKWQWNFGDGSSSEDRNPEHFYTDHGQYTVSLVTFDSTGCQSVYVYPSKINVSDTTPAASMPINRVTVSSNTTVDIEWQASDKPDFGSYVLWRLNNQTGTFEKIATISDRTIAAYKDEDVNTLNNTYTYKLQVINPCDHGLPLSQCPAHTTINVTAAASGSNVNISWTPYKGSEVTTYSVYRQEQNNIPVEIARLSPGQTSYIDTTLECPGLYAYRIEANGLNGTSLFSMSDTSIAHPTGRYSQQIVDVVRSTVVENQSILTEWKEPAIAPEKVTGYKVYRSEGDDGNYEPVIQLPAGATSYLDESVDVQKKHYSYKVTAINTCNSESQAGLHGSNILLEGSSDKEGNINLHWTGYEGWPTAPGYYQIERLNDKGEWEVIQRVTGHTTDYHDTK
jgi:PKD repeat protein